jgi:hypothetical protein
MGIIFVFHCVAKNIKAMYFISDLYSQIWLNLPMDDSPSASDGIMLRTNTASVQKSDVRIKT